MEEETIIAEEEKSPLESLMERINSENDLKGIMFSLLRFCETEKTTEMIIEHVGNLTAGKYMMRTPQTIISWLKDADAIEAVMEEEVQKGWKCTKLGLEAVSCYYSSDKLKALMDSEPDLKGVYLTVLDACRTPKTRDELEDAVEAVMSPEKSGIYPSYFVGNLEEIEAIFWNGKWNITDSGSDFLKLN